MKKLIKLGIFLLVLVGISVLCYFIFKWTGITSIDTLQKVVKSCGMWGWLVFLVLQVIVTVLLCFAPGGSATFITLGVLCFGANYKTFLLCLTGVLISSMLMDLLGRFGGSKIIIKLVGEDDYNKALSLIQEKGMVYVPVMYLLPLFPDDAICCVCGMLKMKFWLHCLYIVLCRGIGVATIVFGISIIPYNTFTTLYDWIICITICVVWISVVLFLARKLDIYLSKRSVNIKYIKKYKEIKYNNYNKRRF